MAELTRTFSTSDQPEVFLSTASISRAVGAAVKAGRVRKIGPRLYTRNTEEPLDQVVRRNWQRIAAAYLPGSVVVDRSAFEAKPSEDGSLFLDAGPNYTARRPIRLPGLTLRPRRGQGPAPGDMPFMEDLHFSGQARRFLDNLRPSRARGDSIARTLSRPEIEDELIRIAARRGVEALNELRDQAREIAPAMNAEREMKLLDDLIGAVQGTRDAKLTTAAARAQRHGLGFDPRRLELFETLQGHLLHDPRPERPERPDSLPALSFVEAYFSNWIEGTEFAVDEAEEIVFKGEVPDGRFEDAHDVLGTFELVNDPKLRARVPRDADDLLALLRSHHVLMLGARPAVEPGSFKATPNQAGGTTFVHPDLVEGTLIEGFRYLEPLPAGLARAIFMMFLVSEVHPFTDGNGRVARVLMNAELTAAGQQRITIPLSYRDNYLQALRALSRSGNPRPLARVLDFAQLYAAAIDWSDLDLAKDLLTQTNAFVTPDVANEKDLRLVLPEGTEL
ncbi:MAG TPA: Fic family protein [Solirubrobacterales bacterium]|nr:Fic family protein [Solirubrobacterales bacterium]